MRRAPFRALRSRGFSARLLCALGLFSASSAAYPQGVEIQTNNAGGTPTQRFRVETGADTVNAWFLNANLGIGIAAPANLLHVAGKARMENLSLYSVAQNPTLYFNGVYSGGDTYIAADPAFQLWHDTAGDLLRVRAAAAGAGGGAITFNEGIVLQPGGNVGIRTTSPSASLHVGAGTDAVLATAASGYLITGNPAGLNIVADDNEIMARNNGVESSLHIQTEGGSVYFHNNVATATEKGTLWDNGDVGIGTVTPAAKLQVVGGPVMPAVGNAATAGIYFPTDPGGGTGDEAYIRYYVEAGENTKLLIGNLNDANDDISFYQNGAEMLTLYDGKVGIGETVPTVTLDVAGTIRARDVFGIGGQNLLVGDDTYVSDVDAAGAMGAYSTGGVPAGARAGLTGSVGIRLGNGGPTLLGIVEGPSMVIVSNIIESNAGSGTVRLHTTGGNNIWFNWDGTFRYMVDVTNVKNFIIDHPADPARYLVHTCIEGPEVAVFYRGTAELRDGRAEIALPAWFEALTREEGRTVLVTPEYGREDEPVSDVAASPVRDGRFRVRAMDAGNPSQRFSWEVKAVRKEAAPLPVEPRKDEIDVHGTAPYRYFTVKDGPAGR